jgi:hypothetical protein
MYQFKNAPLIGGPERCCWCGQDWDNCKSSKSSSLSPDARSKHKKVCHDKVHLALHVEADPATMQATKIALDKLWSNDIVLTQKRSRVEEVASDAGAAAFFLSQDALPVFESDHEAAAAFFDSQDALPVCESDHSH